MAIYRRRQKQKKKHRLLSLLIMGVLLLALIWLVIDKTKPIYDNVMYPKTYQNSVEKYAKKYQVEENLIYAVIKTESGFDPDAISEDNARGLMQITSDTFDWISGKIGTEGKYTHDDLHEPALGIHYGVYFLSYLTEEFGNYRCALAAYHAGRGAVNKWLNDPQYSKDGKTLDKIPYASTDHYVSKVLNNYDKYVELS